MSSIWIISLVGVGSLVVGAWFLKRVVVHIRQGELSYDWPTVPGQVTHSKVTGGDDWLFKVKYRYEVDGVTHYGNTLQACRTEFSRDQAEELQAQYAVGTKVSVHYDPTDHSAAVLIPGVKVWDAWLQIITGVMFVGIGVFCAVLVVVRLIVPQRS